jgi:uncharacterized protein YdbL (DUF1318 family)
MAKRLFAFPLLVLFLSACVTINIYFPAAAAEEAARTIVRDVLQPEEPAENQAPEGNDQSSRAPSEPGLLIAFGMLLEQLVPSAHASQADIDINSSAIRAIRSSMQKRQSQLAPFYQAGAIGFDNQGSVAIRDLGAVGLKDRNRLKKLVADENGDRSRLYREIAQANGHPEWEPDVRATFAKVWAQEAPAGYWYQDGGGSWRQR